MTYDNRFQTRTLAEVGSENGAAHRVIKTAPQGMPRVTVNGKAIVSEPRLPNPASLFWGMECAWLMAQYDQAAQEWIDRRAILNAIANDGGEISQDDYEWAQEMTA